MARPEKKRKINCLPTTYYFKPRGIPINKLEEISLAPDELEAINLADLIGLFQEDAAERMNISRATFGRIILRAHRKIAEAIINGKAIRISDNLPQLLQDPSGLFCEECGRKSGENLQNNKCSKCLTNTKE